MHRRVAIGILWFWLVIAGILVLVDHIATLPRPFNYAHAWISADFSTMGRAFAEYGVGRLGGVPIHNNAPFGARPLAYPNWPPLFPITLGYMFSMFGETETTAHLLMLVILVMTTCVVFALGKWCFGAVGAISAAFTWLAIPVSVYYSHLVWNTSLAVLLMLASVLGFAYATDGDGLKWRWAVFGASMLALAVMTSWEPLFLAPGLVAVSWWEGRRLRLRLALLYGAVGAAVFTGVMTLYIAQYPNLFRGILQVMMYRMGFVARYGVDDLNRNVIEVVQPSLQELSGVYWQRSVDLLGPVTLVALSWAVLRGCEAARRGRSNRTAVPMAGCLGVWCLWFALFPNHAYIHDVQLLIGVPVCAIALGWASKRVLVLLGQAIERGELALTQWAVIALVPITMLGPLASTVRRDVDWSAAELGCSYWLVGCLRASASVMDATAEIRFARDVRAATDEGSVLMSSVESLVPVFYSHRHIIRNVTDGEMAEKVGRRIAENFSGSPVYVAIPPEARARFEDVLKTHRVISETPNAIILAWPSR